jgi:hypothetical protein
MHLLAASFIEAAPGDSGTNLLMPLISEGCKLSQPLYRTHRLNLRDADNGLRAELKALLAERRANDEG